MSTTLDERVVEMKFNNSEFERNVSQSMSTIDKLKAKLNFSGASKGLDEVNASAKKVDFTGMSSGLETVKLKFSALEVIGITALANITNQAINTGKTLVSSLTIDQVTSGWAKYAEKTSSVQTILAATGESMEKVTEQVGKLNWFTDETSYNLTDMINNIGKFTNNGIKLETAVTAMEGIATWAALSGANATEASRAMYNLSQALATGSVKLIDWKSIENANMATQEFKQTVLELAVEEGTLKKIGDDLYETTKKTKKAGETVSSTNFNENLQQLWFTNDVLMKSLDRYGKFTDELNKVSDTLGLTATETLDYLDQYSDKTLDIESLADELGVSSKELTGYFDTLGDETLALGQKAFRAAQEAKTFQEAIDATKDAVSTGWMNTFEIIFGNYEEAKAVWTNLAEDLYTIFAEGGNARNDLLKEALQTTTTWETLVDKITDTGVSLSTFEKALVATSGKNKDTIKEEIKSAGGILEYLKSGKVTIDWFDKAMSKLIDDAEDIVEPITDTKAALEDLEKVAKKVIRGDFGNGQKRVEALTKAGYDYASVQAVVNHLLLGTKLDLDNLTTAQAKEIGMTDEQIKSLKKLQKEAKETGTTVNELLTTGEKRSGRELLIEGFTNILHGFMAALDEFKGAWHDIFGSIDANGIYKAITAFNKMSRAFVVDEKKADKLRRTFKGMFAVLHIIYTLLGGAFKIALNVVKEILAAFNLDVLDATATIGDLLVALDAWVTKNNAAKKAAEILTPAIQKVIKFVQQFYSAVKDSKTFEFLKENFGTFTDLLNKETTEAFSGLSQIFTDFFNQLLALDTFSFKNLSGVLNTFTTSVGSWFKGLGGTFEKTQGNFTLLTTTLKDEVEDTSSPLGKFVSVLGKVKDKVEDVFGNVSWVKLFTMAFSGGMVYGLVKFSKALTKLTKILAGPVGAITNVINAFAGVLVQVKTLIKAKEIELYSQAIMNVAGAVAILAASIWVLSKIDSKQLGYSFLILSGLIGALYFLVMALSKIDPKAAGQTALLVMSLAGSLMLIATAMKIVSNIDQDSLAYSFVIVGMLLAGLAYLGVYMSNNIGAVEKGAGFILAYSVGILIMAQALSKIAKIDPDRFGQSLAGIFVLMGSLALSMSLIGAGDIAAAGAVLVFSLALLVIAQVLKKISRLNPEQLWVGLANMIPVFVTLGTICGLIFLLKDKIAVASGILLSIAGAMILLAVTVKILSKLNPSEIATGVAALSCIGLVIAGFIYLLKLIDYKGAFIVKAAGSIMAIGVAVMAMAVAMRILGGMEVGGILKASFALVAIATALSILMVASKFAGTKILGTIIALTVGVAGLIMAVAVLAMLDPKDLVVATLCLDSIMGMLALMIAMSQFAAKALPGLVSLSLVIGVTALAFYALSLLETEDVMFIALALDSVFLALSAALISCVFIGTFAHAALVGLQIMVLAVAEMTALFLGLGALMKLDWFKSGLEGAVDAMGLIGDALGSFIGGVAGTTMLRVTENLPAIGRNISSFWESAEPFFTGIQNVDGGVYNAVANLINAVKAINGVKFDDTSVNWDGFSDILDEVGPAVSAFSEEVAGVKPDAVSAACEAAEMVIDMAKVIPNDGGLWGALVGNNSLGTFTTNMRSFGSGLKDFCTNTEGINSENVVGACEAGKTIIDMANAIPNDGGLWGMLVGNNDLGTFAENIKSFGEGLSDFCVASEGINTDGAVDALELAQRLVALNNGNVTKSGGWAQMFQGESSLASLAAQLPSFGNHLVQFCNIVKDKVDYTDKIDNVLTFLTRLTDTMRGIDVPKSEAFSGLGDSIVSFVDSMKKLQDLENINTDAFMNLAGDLESLNRAMSTQLSSELPSRIEAIAEALGTLGTNAGEAFTANIHLAEDSCTTAVDYMLKGVKSNIETNRSEISSAMSNLVSEIRGAFSEDEFSFYTVGTSVVTKLTNALTSQKEVIRKAAQKITSQFSDGLVDSDAKKFIEDAAVKMADVLADKFKDLSKDKSSDIYLAGTYVVSGLTSGMEDENEKVESASEKLWTTINKTFRRKDNADINSPSRAMAKNGAYVVQGLVVGMNKKKSLVVKASTETFTTVSTAADKMVDNVKASIEDLVKQLGKLSTNKYWKNLEGVNPLFKMVNDRVVNQVPKGFRNTVRHIMSMFTFDNLGINVGTASASELKEAYEEATSTLYSFANALYQADATEQDLTDDFGHYAKAVESKLRTLRQSIKQNLQAPLDLFSQSLKTDIDIFSQFTETEAGEDDPTRDLNGLMQTWESQINGNNEFYDLLLKLYGVGGPENDGFNHRLIKMIEEMGAEAGLAYARSMAEASAEEIKEANAMFESLDKITAKSLDESMAENEALVEEYYKGLKKLAERGLDYNTLMQLYNMAPDEAIATIRTLLAKGDDEFDAFVEKRESINHDMALKANELLAVIAEIYSKENGYQYANGFGDGMEEWIKENYGKSFLDNLIANAEEEAGKKTSEESKTTADSSVTETADNLTSSQNQNTMTSAGKTLGKAVLNGIKKYLSQSKGKTVGYNVCMGIKIGLENNESLVTEAARQVAAAALEAANAELDINSPSRAFMQTGMYSDMGLAQGLVKYSGLVKSAGAEVADSALHAIRDSISHISDAVDAEMDVQPVITPVIDLTDVTKGAKSISSLMSRNSAISISKGMSADASDNTSGVPGSTNTNGNTYTFTQNNYSPKALSRTEIYRQTKNQFSNYKEALNLS